MVKRSFIATILLSLALFCFNPNQISAAPLAENIPQEINPNLLINRWSAQWITPPNVSLTEFGIYHFRRSFTLQEKPEKFIIHVSADNRYQLFVNGQRTCFGPARGDQLHWRFETVDIAPYLAKGKNTLAAVVWNFADHGPVAQMSFRTAFLVQGNTDKEAIVNTKPDTWKVTQNKAYSLAPIDRAKLGWAYFAIGTTDNLNAAEYPWGWEKIEFEDTTWAKPNSLGNAAVRGNRDSNQHILLVPRIIPTMEETQIRFAKIARVTNTTVEDKFLLGQNELIIGPNKHATILLDQSHLTTAYPEFIVSSGRNAKIELTYAEALIDDNGQKGNRNEVGNRHIRGYTDTFITDGGYKRSFRPLWFRTYRYVQLDIHTKEEPLMIHDLYAWFSGYPFKETATFQSSDPTLKDIWNVGWRTARLCAGETYYDCPYYEQLQYVGDTRIQALVSLYVAGDDRLMRNAIMHFDESRTPDGLTASRYPTFIPQVIPPYSLFWISMIHDHWMYSGDDDFARQYLVGIRGVLNWYENQIDDIGMVGDTPWWNFVDWIDTWPHGQAPGASKGHSSITTMQFIYNLHYAAQLAEALDKPSDAIYYRYLAKSLTDATYKFCWDKDRQLLADTPEKKTFSQHANVMAVLVDMIPADQQKPLMQRILNDPTIAQCTFYYRFYLVRAMKKAGLADQYITQLQPWRDMLNIGLTTFAEKPEPTRSDCHAWSASPNYDFLATICGIEPAEPGFKKITIAPALGPLTSVQATMPHPQGTISVDLKRKGQTGLEATITLPQNTTGTFLWHDSQTPLKSGTQKITLD